MLVIFFHPKVYIYMNEISFPDGIFLGEIDSHGKKTGLGQMNYNNGDVYNGEFIGDNREGVGKIKYANGDTYDGKWRRDMKYIGIFQYRNGDVFTGGFKGDNKLGRMKYQNGDFYQGYFYKDKKGGKEGGKGKMVYGNGDVYEGEWYEDERHGNGIMKYIGTTGWQHGAVYVGEWEMDKQFEGKMTFPDGRSFYGFWDYYGEPECYADEEDEDGIDPPFELEGDWSGIDWFCIRNGEIRREERREGIAYEIHNEASDLFDKEFWNSYYHFIGGYPDSTYTKMTVAEIRNYVEDKFIELIQKNHLEELPQKKINGLREETLKSKLKRIFDKLALAVNICGKPDYKVMMGKTIDWIETQNKEFQELYVMGFIEQNAFAYPFDPQRPNADTVSCPKGIVEKIVLEVKKTLEGLLTEVMEDGKVDVKKYNEKFQDKKYLTLYQLFKKISFSKNEAFNNELREKWTTDGWKEVKKGKEWSDMTVDERRQNYIDYMVLKYEEEGIVLNGLRIDVEEDAKKYAYIFAEDGNPAFGGSKKKSKFKKNYASKKRKIKKNSTRKFRSMKSMEKERLGSLFAFEESTKMVHQIKDMLKMIGRKRI